MLNWVRVVQTFCQCVLDVKDLLDVKVWQHFVVFECSVLCMQFQCSVSDVDLS